MQLSEDSFRALARSSPWRFRALHFKVATHTGLVEAWLRRPGRLRVVDGHGREHVVTELPHTTTVLASARVGDGPAEPRTPPQPRPASTMTPVYRPDGLVAERPSIFEGAEYDDPMWQNYQWVAMLDPVELSHDVRLAGLREDEHHGRPVWRARVWPEDDYEPRCTCCQLLPSELVDREEWSGRPDLEAWLAGRVYPDGFEVALDVQTGVVVALEPVGGNIETSDIDVEILEVDAGI